MSTSFFDIVPEWARDSTVRAINLRMARSALRLTRAQVSASGVLSDQTLCKYEREDYGDAELPILHALLHWYQLQGIVFGTDGPSVSLDRQDVECQPEPA